MCLMGNRTTISLLTQNHLTTLEMHVFTLNTARMFQNFHTQNYYKLVSCQTDLRYFSCFQHTPPTNGCWSETRHSVFNGVCRELNQPWELSLPVLYSVFYFVSCKTSIQKLPVIPTASRVLFPFYGYHPSPIDGAYARSFQDQYVILVSRFA